jgi:hypothetical protein
MLAQTKLLVPKVLPSNREAPNSMARLVIPEENTVKYKYFFLLSGLSADIIWETLFGERMNNARIISHPTNSYKLEGGINTSRATLVTTSG